MPSPPRFLIVPVLMTLAIFTNWEPHGFGHGSAVAQTIESSQQETNVSSEEKMAEASRLIEQARQQFLGGELRESLQPLEKALEIYREMGNLAGEGQVWMHLGATHMHLEQYEDAIAFLQQSLEINRETDHKFEQGHALLFLSSSYSHLGQYEEMLASSEQSLAIAHEIGDRNLEMRASGSLGLAYVNLGRFEEATEPMEQGLTIARELSRSEEKKLLESLGIAYLSLGQEQAAIFRSPQSLTFARGTGEEALQAIIREGLVAHLEHADRGIEFYQKALDAFEQHFAIAPDMGLAAPNDPSFLLRAYHDLSSLYFDLGLYGRALVVQQRSLALLQALGDRDREAGRLYTMGGVFGSIGRSLAKQNQPELAIVFFKQSVYLREENQSSISDVSQRGKQRFLDKVLRDYSVFAELLQQQGQNSDAEAILNLMERHAVEDLGGQEEHNSSAPEIPELRTVEQEILSRYYQFIQVDANTDVDYSQLIQREPNSDVDAFVSSSDIQLLVSQLRNAP